MLLDLFIAHVLTGCAVAIRCKKPQWKGPILLGVLTRQVVRGRVYLDTSNIPFALRVKTK